MNNQTTRHPDQRIYLNVPLEDRHKLKVLAKCDGAQWDLERKSWFVSTGTDLVKFQEWIPHGSIVRVDQSRETMTYFSFRAECPADVDRFRAECLAAEVVISLEAFPDHHGPDVEVEFQAAIGFDALLNIARRVVDGHVILQTLRECRLSDNSLERDYDRR